MNLTVAVVAETTRFGRVAAVGAGHKEAVELIIALTAGAAYRVGCRVVLRVDVGS